MPNLQPWTYRDQTFDCIPEGLVGFVYLITAPDGRKYIGKKQFFSRTSKLKPGKSRRTWKTKESNWRVYLSSCDELKALAELFGPESFRRELLHLCASKREMSYLETAEQFRRDVLYARLPDGTREYINSNISGKWFAEQEAA